jgi:hypothetical protein
MRRRTDRPLCLTAPGGRHSGGFHIMERDCTIEDGDGSRNSSQLESCSRRKIGERNMERTLTGVGGDVHTGNPALSTTTTEYEFFLN